MTLEAVIERVAAADSTADRDRLRRTVLDTIAALGLEVHPETRQVYSPAALEERMQRSRPSLPQQTGVRFRRRY
jgi:hypothetical protein